MYGQVLELKIPRPSGLAGSSPASGTATDQESPGSIQDDRLEARQQPMRCLASSFSARESVRPAARGPLALLLTFDPSDPTLGRMSTQEPLPILQGTLDLLVLRTLASGTQHGQGIARAIQDVSRNALLVE